MNFNIPITNYNISDSYSSSGEEESFIKYTTKKEKDVSIILIMIDVIKLYLIVIVIFVENVIGLIKKI